MMKLKLVFMSALLLTLSACGQPTGVAVVDVDAVFSKTPLESTMKNSIKARLGQMKAALKQNDEHLQQQIAEYQKSVGDQPGQQESLKLESMRKQALAQMKAAREQANKQMNAYEKALVKKAMEHVRVAANEVAVENGFDVVVAKNDKLVLGYSRDIDISVPVANRVNEMINKAAGN